MNDRIKHTMGTYNIYKHTFTQEDSMNLHHSIKTHTSQGIGSEAKSEKHNININININNSKKGASQHTEGDTWAEVNKTHPQPSVSHSVGLQPMVYLRRAISGQRRAISSEANEKAQGPQSGRGSAALLGGAVPPH